MGREAASALSRWFVLNDYPLNAQLVAVCDSNQAAREWFRKVPTVEHFASSYSDLLNIPELDVAYVAVPHNLHEEIYSAVLDSGKDLLAEKPFGLDVGSA